MLGFCLCVSLAECELIPAEIRRHWETPGAADVASSASEIERLVLENRIAASFIMRGWYKEPTQGGRWRSKGAARNDTVVLFHLVGPRVKFAWTSSMDFPQGVWRCEFRVWERPDDRVTLVLTMRGVPTAADLETYLRNRNSVKAKDALPPDELLLAEVDFAGRKLPVPVSEWRRGLEGQDRIWLQSAVDEDLRRALKAIAVVAANDTELGTLCDMVLTPLLGSDAPECEKASVSFSDSARKPDCDFDAWFGETCPLDVLMRSKTAKQPLLVPNPTPRQ